MTVTTSMRAKSDFGDVPVEHRDYLSRSYSCRTLMDCEWRGNEGCDIPSKSFLLICCCVLRTIFPLGPPTNDALHFYRLT